MDWTQTLTIIGVIVAIISWLRSDMKEGFKNVDDKFRNLDDKFRDIDDKFRNLDEKITDVDRRLCRLEGVLSAKDCCVLKEDKSQKKAL